MGGGGGGGEFSPKNLKFLPKFGESSIFEGSKIITNNCSKKKEKKNSSSAFSVLYNILYT